MKKFTNKFFSEISDNKNYFLLSLLISVYIFIPYYFIIMSLIYGIAVLVSMIILFMLSKTNKTIFLLFSIISLFFSTIILHVITHWGTKSLVSRIEVASLSPQSESIEYLATYINKTDIIVAVYFILGSFLIYKFFSKCKHSYKLVKTLSMSLLLIIIFALISVDKINKVLPYFYVDKYLNVIDVEKLQKRNEYIRNNIQISSNRLEYDKIVIVMGESASKWHMNLYGYENNTTPFLNSLINSEYASKYNVIAPTNQTRYSVPIDLTPANVNNFNAFFTEKSIVTTFKEYGYKTYWISNQGAVGLHENFITSIAKEADVTKMANAIYEDAKDDNILIKYLNTLDTDKEEKEVYFFHLMGSHASYSARYPKDSALFKNPKNIIEEYDNSIHHTDEILNEIYNKFKDTKLLLMYLSDHGEVVTTKKNGHGYSPAYQEEYEIPLIIYSSINNERLLKLQNKNKNLILNIKSFNYLAEYVAGIDVNISNISYSEEVFTLEPANIINYNKLKRFK